jgi:hypothetical protein
MRFGDPKFRERRWRHYERGPKDGFFIIISIGRTSLFGSTTTDTLARSASRCGPIFEDL